MIANLQDFKRALPDAETWLADIQQRLKWHDRDKAYLAFVAALHALRDSLPRDEAFYLGAQLPVLLRGLYYEGWPSVRPHRAGEEPERLHRADSRGCTSRPRNRCRGGCDCGLFTSCRTSSWA